MTPPDSAPAQTGDTAKKLSIEGYDIDILVQGYPGKSVCHGGLGWSTIALLRGHGKVAVIDTGSFNMRRTVKTQIEKRGVTTAEVTDLILTHSHYDHSINWPMFPNATIHITRDEMAWAVNEPDGNMLVPEFYVRELEVSPQLRKIEEGSALIPNMTAHLVPGHTPGSAIFIVDGGDRDMIFTGDAAKNRAELLTRTQDLTMDQAKSNASIARIWEFWEQKPGSVIVPGHDVPMVLVDGKPTYIGERECAITAWLGEDLDTTTLFELTGE